MSFELWLMLTWSLGCTGFLDPSLPPRISIARFEMTSLTFMLLCVPLPVWKTTRGKWSMSLPEMTYIHNQLLSRYDTYAPTYIVGGLLNSTSNLGIESIS